MWDGEMDDWITDGYAAERDAKRTAKYTVTFEVEYDPEQIDDIKTWAENDLNPTFESWDAENIVVTDLTITKREETPTTETTVEAVAKAIEAQMHRAIEAGIGSLGGNPHDLARAALAAIPEPATGGGVTRSDIIVALEDADLSYEGPTQYHTLADAILALFPPAPSTVGTVEDGHWECGRCGNNASSHSNPSLPPYACRWEPVWVDTTPATTRDVGAEDLITRTVRAALATDADGDDRG